ncbi:MAG: winged helix-turn-helix domain-containing protein, partial [Casimicrobiaceae bacterium]
MSVLHRPTYAPATARVSASADARIAYRAGLEASHRGDPAASALLNGALKQSLAAADVQSAALASAASMINGQLLGDFCGFPEHIGRLALLRDPVAEWADPGDELIALSGLAIGLLYFAPADPFLERFVERIMVLLAFDHDINARFVAGRTVLYYTEPRDLRVLAQRVYSLLRPGIDRPGLTPHRLGHWLIFWSRCARYAKEPHQERAALREARELAERHGLRDILAWLAFVDIEQCLPEGDVRRAEQALAVAEKLADPSALRDLSRLDFLKSKLALMQRRGGMAVFHASRGLRYCVELNSPPPLIALYTVNEAEARISIEDFAGARTLLATAAELAPGQYAQEVRDMVTLVDAYVAAAYDEPEAAVLLARAWGSMRERQFYDTFDGFPEFVAKLCVQALDHGIEADFVRRLIELRNVVPPAGAPEAWPWPVRIHTLGGFRVERAGSALTFEGKAQKKPIELCKVLIAFGGRAVAKEKLYDVLWTDAEPGAASAALDVVISRLRKLLGDADAIRIDEGKVGLDPARVWLDIWAFDHDVDALQQALHAQPDPVVVERLGRSLLTRYRGAFLGSEDPQRWSLAARDRWQNRFRRSL